MTDASAIYAAYLAKAERALEEAKLLLKDNRTEGACSRAYYAMFDAAHASLFATNNETVDAPIKTHQGTIAEFGKSVVLGGWIDPAFGRALNRVQNMRLLADYSAEPPPTDEVRWAVEQAEAFIIAVRERFAT